MVNCDYSICKHCNTSNNTCKKENISISNGEHGAYCINIEERLDYIQSHYKVQKLSNAKYDFIVFSQCYISLFNYLSPILKDISAKLDNESQQVKIIFDNLMSYGNNSNRFIELEYDLKRKEFTEPKRCNVPKKDQIRNISLEYYKNNENILNRGILTSVQIKLIKKGISI